MSNSILSDRTRLDSTHKICEHIAEKLDARFSVRLWDGRIIPLGQQADTQFYLSISGPGVLGSLLRRPTLENLLRLYATKNIDFHGGDIMSFGDIVREKRSKKKHRNIDKSFLFRQAIPLLLTPSDQKAVSYAYAKDEVGRVEAKRNNKDYIQFHYDLSNDFYKLFLDEQMQYSCGYFTDWDNSLDQAQKDKLEMICRKLRLKPGEKLLDIGCGWGGLVCYAAKNFGVSAYGVTLSQEQFDYTQNKIKILGLENQVTVELRDYNTVEGQFDKIASIGMFEHVGIANFPKYFGKISSLLPDRGLVLNHGIARRAKKSKHQFQKIRPARRWILKHIFPGSELDHIGHTLECMESCGFEVHDVENWRDHYARTSRLWCERLSANKEKAITLVGEEKYRLWVAYLAGVAFSFTDGPLRVYQTVASKHGSRGHSKMPPTREDLYI